MGEIDGMWFQLYSAVRRTNEALRLLNTFTETQYANINVRRGELRFLRGLYYFMLKILFNRIPHMDETVPAEQYNRLPTMEFTSDQLWDKIAQDFEFAAANYLLRNHKLAGPIR